MTNKAMTHKTAKTFRNVAVASTLSFALIAASATAAGAADLAEIQPGAASIHWSLDAAHDGAVLNVSGPGEARFSSTFGPGETPSFSLFDDYGKQIADGTYAWEIRIVPALDPNVRAALEEARVIGDEAIADELRAAGVLPAQTAQSGHFSVAQGAFVVPTAAAEQAAEAKAAAPGGDTDLPNDKAQTFITDVIVQGSSCIGIDCTSTESFGFDTLKLKENNLRIKFDDTSSSASFPGNDWQLTANDSSNGGANKFSIDDVTGGKTPFTVLAGAPNNALLINASGHAGFGTNNPVVDLHAVNGNSPTLRLEQDGSSGFTPQVLGPGRQRDATSSSATSPTARSCLCGSSPARRRTPSTSPPDGDHRCRYRQPLDGSGIHVKRAAGAAADLLTLENDSPVRIQLNNTGGDKWTLNSARATASG